MMDHAITAYNQAICDTDCDRATSVVREAEARGVSPEDIVFKIVIEMLLGRDDFSVQLADGAFFLLESRAEKWEEVIYKAFGTTNFDVIRDIFHEDRKYILGIRTPCSDDFTAEAEQAAAMAGLPLRWMDASLDRLEVVLRAAITKKSEQPQCAR
jgi:hypothetical protein